MKIIPRFTIFALIIVTFGCMSEARKAEQAERKVRKVESLRVKKALYDSMAVALHRFETETQRNKPARRRCKATFDTFTEALRTRGARNFLDSRIFYENAAWAASFNAFEVFGNVKEAGLEAMDAIIDYGMLTTLTTGSTSHLIMLRIKSKIETAKANYDYCENNANAIKGVFDDLNSTKSAR